MSDPARNDTPQKGARVRVLLNGGSGTSGPAAEDGIRRALDTCGMDAEIERIDHGRDIVPAARRAVDEGVGTIVAAGGDGTISAVAGVVQGSDAALGILPLGTFNYFARSLDIPTDIEGAVRLLATGARRPVRIATINDRAFLNNASLGAYPAILKTRERTYRRWGRSRAAAYWSVLVTLVTLRHPLRLQIEANGETITRRTPLVFAVNNAFQLNRIGLRGEDEIAAGRLTLYVAPESGRWGMLHHALSLATGRAENAVNFDMIAAERIRIDTRRNPRDVACDGERSRMCAPFDLRVVQGVLTVIVPQARQGDTR